MNPALYDLRTMPTTFDFSAWVVIAKSHGCDHVNFHIDGSIQTAKYPAYLGWRRFGNILVPLTLLAGMTFDVGNIPVGQRFPYLAGDVEKCYRELGKIELLKPERKIGKSGYVTITIRDSFRNTYRNSNRAEWEKVKAYLLSKGKEVVWLDESEQRPLALEYRLALYSEAEMNLGASGGPMWMCAYSEAPYLIFNVIPEGEHFDAQYNMVKLNEFSGITEGFQYSFRTEQQRIVWKPDRFEHIISAYEQMIPAMKEAA